MPLPTFILGPSSPELSGYYDNISADGGELCTNVTCLGMAAISWLPPSLLACAPGQRGVYTTSAGLQIAYLSGCYDNTQYKGSESRDKMVTALFCNQILSLSRSLVAILHTARYSLSHSGGRARGL